VLFGTDPDGLGARAGGTHSQIPRGPRQGGHYRAGRRAGHSRSGRPGRVRPGLQGCDCHPSDPAAHAGCRPVGAGPSRGAGLLEPSGPSLQCGVGRQPPLAEELA